MCSSFSGENEKGCPFLLQGIPEPSKPLFASTAMKDIVLRLQCKSSNTLPDAMFLDEHDYMHDTEVFFPATV